MLCSNELIPAISSILADNSIHKSYKRPFLLPFNTSIASATSKAFPIFLPRGTFISVTIVQHFLLAIVPIFFIISASFSADSIVFIKAPEPYFTSSRIQSAFIASFLLMILAHIRGILSTVAVAFLSSYIFLSAGHIFLLCDIIENPVLLTMPINSEKSSSVLYPFMLSSLSIVPPVCPNPLPDILGT